MEQNTALGATAKKEGKIIFISDAHEKFYYEKLKEVRYQDVYHKALCYCLGICGEHGGDPSSVEFCHKIGLDYVSCSPFRVPIARLAAAQAAINNGGK